LLCLGLTNANHTQHTQPQRAVTQDSNNQIAGIAQKAARNRRRQRAANIRSGGPIHRKHLPDGTIWHASEN